MNLSIYFLKNCGSYSFSATSEKVFVLSVLLDNNLSIDDNSSPIWPKAKENSMTPITIQIIAKIRSVNVVAPTSPNPTVVRV